jgi:hypothetical protein
MARDCGLADRERLDEFAGAAFALAEHLDDVASGRVREDFERVHAG